MGGRRTRDKHLPPRVYLKSGRYYYVDKANKWTSLGKALPEMYRGLAALLGPAAPSSTVRELIARYEVEELPSKAPKTRANRRLEFAQLLKIFGAMVPEDIEPHDVRDYYVKRGKTEQARHEVRALSAVLSWGRQIGACSLHKDSNPCFKLGLKGRGPRSRYVTDDEFWRVHDLAPAMMRGAMKLALLAGMDGATIRMLEKRHLTDDGIRFMRPKTQHQDGAREQLVEWSDELRQTVKEILALPPQLRRVLIATRKGTAYTIDGFQTQWQRVMRKFPKDCRFHFHDLRAKSASDASSTQEAADRLGHADPALTERIYRRLPRRSKALKPF